MKHFGNWFWSTLLGVALIAITAGFFGGSLQSRGAMPGAVAVPEVAPAPIERALFGPRGEGSLTPFDPPVEAAVVDRPEGWVAPEASSASSAARLAIVICGMGVDGALDGRFSAIPYQLSFAIPVSGNVRSDVQRSDPKALLVEADQRVSLDKITARFASVHAGGVITPLAGHPGHADALASRLHDSGAFLVDGRADGASQFYEAAHDGNVAAATRDIVIDAFPEQSYVTYMLRQAVRLAQRTGVAVAVGHADPETYEALRSSLEQLTREGDVQVVPVGDLAR
ncbi:MAG: divergent polysaccharide deacetylase family protein [Vulcanimicrobiaceae bacterium]